MKSDITRQLSASVYQNSSLRDQILNFVKDNHRAIINSNGLDIGEILKHTFNAKRVERKYFIGLFLPAIIFWVGILLALGGGLMKEDIMLLSTYWAFVVSYIIVIVRDINSRNFLKQNLSKYSYNDDFQYSDNKKNLESINSFINRISGNVIFYSGYSPFVGCGIDIGGWSLVVDIDKGKREIDQKSTPISFEVSELYSTISKEINSLRLPNLTVQDKIFINGKTIRNNRELLPNELAHPVQNISTIYKEAVMNNSVRDARFYKVFQIIDWEGDLILSTFFRLQKDEKTLFIENNYFLIPPIKEEFKAIDTVKVHSGIKYYFVWLGELFFRTFIHTIWSIIKVSGYAMEKVNEIFESEKSAMLKLVRSSPDFDYGASTSIREEVSQPNYAQYFQKLDKERYLKTIEKRLFNLIGDFLDEKNIDSSEFKEREIGILNHGVIITGGKLISENITVGKKSKINLGNNEKIGK
jgi:hypothetical protein